MRRIAVTLRIAAAVVGFGALAVALSASRAFASQAQPAAERYVAVAEFTGPDAAAVRAAVLTTLSNHPDVVVVSLDDIAFASRRFRTPLETVEGRRNLSEELHVELWLDAVIERNVARLMLSRSDGEQIMTLEAPAALVAERMWESMGTLLSVSEERARAVRAHTVLARAKLASRIQQETRLREQGRARLAATEKWLTAQRVLAVQKRSDRTHEAYRMSALARQRDIDRRK